MFSVLSPRDISHQITGQGVGIWSPGGQAISQGPPQQRDASVSPCGLAETCGQRPLLRRRCVQLGSLEDIPSLPLPFTLEKQCFQGLPWWSSG